jgi:choline dehydrogenase-like flavoprotein
MHSDVLIIGAGPSGGAAALRLIRAGLSVVCLEQGEWPDRMAYPGGKPNAELTALKQWSWDPNVRAAPSDYAIDVTDSDTQMATFNGVGGGTVLFNAAWPRLLPSNFRSRSMRGYADDWPLDYAELQPYYEQTDREIGASGLGGNPVYPAGQEPPLPPLPIWPGGLAVARAHARLGWHWWPDTNAILSRPYDGRHSCVARGTCVTGCGEGAKASADVVYWRHVTALGGQLITGARVTRIVLDGQGRAAGAEWYDPDGAGHLQSADVVLVAANGIGTPRLLLASANDRFPDGLANRSGLVGRNLMLHHHGFATGTFAEPLETWRGQNGSWINSYQFYESDDSHGAPGTVRWTMCGLGASPLHTALGLGPAGWGPGHHEALAADLGRTLGWYLCVEDIPSQENRVELSATQTDSAGLPIPVVHYHAPDESQKLLAWHQERAVQSLMEAGAVRASELDMVKVTGHYMGTARMGDDRQTSVVDRNCMSHDIPNLGILDGSVFVTSAGVNPTTTIVALAARAADSLLRHRGDLSRPDRPTTIWTGPQTVARRPDPVSYERVELTDGERQRLAELADQLIPGDDNHPWPSTLATASGATALTARPDLGPALRRALARDGAPRDALAALTDDDPEARAALELVVAGGYYQEAKVWEAIGYPGQLARPAAPDNYPAYVEEGLLDHMLAEDSD